MGIPPTCRTGTLFGSSHTSSLPPINQYPAPMDGRGYLNTKALSHLCAVFVVHYYCYYYYYYYYYR